MKNIFFSFVFILSLTTGYTQDDVKIRQKNFNTEKSIALKGYDAISYFSGKPVKGKSSFQVNNKGIVYYFSNQPNLDAFKTNPVKYEPAYGGWCAYAMGVKGEKVEVDPQTFKIINGKIYLFYNKFFSNTLTDWNEDEANLKKKADVNWSKLIVQ